MTILQGYISQLERYENMSILSLEDTVQMERLSAAISNIIRRRK